MEVIDQNRCANQKTARPSVGSGPKKVLMLVLYCALHSVQRPSTSINQHLLGDGRRNSCC